jgi:hypothetical protein
MKINSALKRIKKLLFLFLQVGFLFSCGQTSNEKASVNKDQFVATTLEVDISNKNCLDILLAKDGTINRKGSDIVDSTDKNFFMGISDEKLFDNLIETVPDDLLSYCGQPSPNCDTTKQTCKVKMSFSSNKSDTGFEYCINGTLNDLPKPIKEYIANAIKITDPWYQTQKNLINKK